MDLEPGWHRDVPFDEYRKWPLLSPSTLKWGATSMKHLKAAIDGEIERTDSPDLRLGRAFHCRLLEPESFAARWPVATKCAVEMKSGERKGEKCGSPGSVQVDGEWRCGRHGAGGESVEDYLTVDESARVAALAKSIGSHPGIKLLRSRGGCELAGVWELDGLRMKCRLDKFIPPGGGRPAVVVDLKKCQVGKVERSACERAIFDYRYHIQAAAYTLAAKQIEGLDDVRFVWVFFEDKPPYDVMILQADGMTLSCGEVVLRKIVGDYQKCVAKGVWPGVTNGLQVGGLPEWYLKQFARMDEHDGI